MESQTNLNVFQKMVYALTKPEELFKFIRKEPFSAAFLYFLMINAISKAIRVLLFLANFPVSPNETVNSILMEFVTTTIFSFIFAGIFHIFAKLFGGYAPYEGTFKAYVYGMTPSILFGWIPYIGILGSIYGIYIFIKGISFIHAISLGKAFLVWFIPILILLLLILLLFLLVGVAVISYLAGFYSSNPKMFT
ncbi:MAG: YIP1 family protein [Candidatus Aenigmatarchaeota archaeon]